MPKLYFLGGENVHRQDAREVNERAFKDAGESPSVLVFSWARASFDRGYQRRRLLENYFNCLGVGAVNFVEYSEGLGDIERKMLESDLIYLTGGVPSVLIERLKKIGVDNLLQSYASIIIGRSAGALALSQKYIVTFRSNSANKIIDGLGLAALTLKVHYKIEQDENLKFLSRDGRIYAIPKGSALVYDDSVLSFIGNVYLFENGEKRKLV
jgi:peptidase E